MRRKLNNRVFRRFYLFAANMFATLASVTTLKLNSQKQLSVFKNK